ncbi:hypothetical protein BCR41DRAFT_333298 [Lobosporangium transversale]|uniref:Protein-S-isoprenylcysteine O-methyltransferase n=1 Tax=Lobosporangium transversale TaxID=64571 RepID=A0A1Y2GW78_9FUNG|nr:hypothetical protein BCR41DRAFT_333298 [Lobosporangium transversale]ORZ26548.1 hypothetical protein BCR41DRAFT_333298 [Lobosporangium transversale]|eukprot:XP_021884313.1 hypothetical protein BCR41DRAFT_333298 [Lobosporangium transversale]
MFAKAFCISIVYLSFVRVTIPPRSSESVWVSKTDKVCPEKSFIVSRYHPYILVGLVSLWTLSYLALLLWSDSDDTAVRPEIAQLHELKPWHIILTVIALAGSQLRAWSFRTLSWFFTYQLTIRPNHRLITTGPYTYLRHPSYTGGVLNLGAFWALLWHQGLFEVFSMYAVHVLEAMGLISSSWLFGVVGLFLWITIGQVIKRVRAEEAMMRAHFGREWDVYASQRWKFVPFVY